MSSTKTKTVKKKAVVPVDTSKKKDEKRIYTLEEILSFKTFMIHKRFKSTLLPHELKSCGLVKDVDGKTLGDCYTPEFCKVLIEVNNKHYKDRNLQEYQNKLNIWADEKFRKGELPVQIAFQVRTFSGKDLYMTVHTNFLEDLPLYHNKTIIGYSS